MNNESKQALAVDMAVVWGGSPLPIFAYDQEKSWYGKNQQEEITEILSPHMD